MDEFNNDVALKKDTKPATHSWDAQTADDHFETEHGVEVEEESSEPVEQSEPDQVETEEEEQVGAEEPVEAQAEEESQDEVPADATPKAQKRIQALAQQKKALEQQLAESLMANAKAQSDLLAFQQRQFQVAEEQRQAQERAQWSQRQLTERRAALEAAGFDPTDPRNQFIAEYHDELQQLKYNYQALQQELQQTRYQEAVRQYETKLDGALSTTLKAYDIAPEQLTALKQQAYAIAQLNNYVDPNVAVQQVLTPILQFLPKKKASVKAVATRNVGEEEKTALRAVALKAPSGGKKKGDRVSGSNSKSSFQEVRDELFGADPWK